MGKHNLGLMERVILNSIPEPNSGCWLWLGTTNGKYPQLKVKKKNIYAHRISCESVHGCLGELNALHKCDNTFCVNPEHLYPGTQKQNVADCRSRGRLRGGAKIPQKGSERPLAKLTEADVREIIKSDERGIDLAERYGVSAGIISEIRSGKRWKHVHGRGICSRFV
jgi:hypothetical protein